MKRNSLIPITLMVLLGVGLLAQDAPIKYEPVEGEDNYGLTPPEYLPFGRFENPYKRFFLVPLEYTGYGRKIPEPTGLETIKIGFIGPIMKTVSVATGGASHEGPMGRKMLQGAQLAIEHANQKGGYRGSIPYELVIRNDNGLWGATGNEVIDLAYKENVWAILGTIDGANSHIAIRVALKAEIPIVNSGDTDPTFTETRIPWAFRCITDDRQMCYLLADYAFKKLKLKRVAAIRASNRYGRMSIDEFRDAATRLGFPFITELQYAIGDTDFSRQLSRIKSLDADGVITYGDATESALILKQMRAMGMKQWFFASDRAVSDEFLRLFDGNLERVVAGLPYDPTSQDPRHVSFVEAFQDRFGDAPETYAAHAYDGISMITAAIEKAGLNRALIRDAIAELGASFHGVTGMKRFDYIYNDMSPACLAIANGTGFDVFTRAELFP